MLKCSGRDIILPKYIKNITVKHGPFKALGIWFSENENEIETLNIENRIKKMETMMNIWTGRHLSLKGKITIIRTLILPQIQFLFSSIAISAEILKKIDGLLRNFLWNKKPSKIKKSTIIANIEKGGLKMVDVYSVHDAAKFSWIKRLLDQKNSKWNYCLKLQLAAKFKRFSG